jgi:PKD repeat protein
VKTLAGAPLGGASITLAVSPSIASVSPTAGITDAGGHFLTTLSAYPSAAGSLQVTASATGSSPSSEFGETLTGQGSQAVSITPTQPPTTVHINMAPVAQFRVVSPDSSRTITLDGRYSYDPDGAIVSYLWDFGDGSSASGPMVTHTYAGGGQYTVTLTVNDNAGGRSIFSNAVSIAFPKPPVPIPVASPMSGTAPLTVSISGQQSYDPDGSIALYAWNFGDGASGQGPRTSHTYRASGTYSVTLTVTDSQGIPATSSTVRITALPKSDQPKTTQPPTTAPPTTVATPTPTPTIGSLRGGISWWGSWTLTRCSEASCHYRCSSSSRSWPAPGSPRSLQCQRRKESHSGWNG